MSRVKYRVIGFMVVSVFGCLMRLVEVYNSVGGKLNVADLFLTSPPGPLWSCDHFDASSHKRGGVELYDVHFVVELEIKKFSCRAYLLLRNVDFYLKCG